MVLLKRLMWPRKGDEVQIYKSGEMLIEGHVIHGDDRSITILGRNSATLTLNTAELSRGIDDGSIVVKKKTGPLPSK
jgi:hypothetical protein